MPPTLKALTLSDLVEQQYGVKTDVKTSVVSVGTTPTQVLDNNPNRVGYILINLSTNAAFINFDTSVSTNNGIFLAQQGGSFSQNWKDDFNIVGYSMYGIVASGSNNIFVAEIFTIGH